MPTQGLALKMQDFEKVWLKNMFLNQNCPDASEIQTCEHFQKGNIK